MSITMANLRAALNDELGLPSDSDTRFGSTTLRNKALATAIRKLWPRVAKLTAEDVTGDPDTRDYVLSTVWDVMAIEARDSTATVTGTQQPVTKYRTYRDEVSGDTVLSLGFTPTATQTLRVIGWVPYTVPDATSEASTTDIPDLMLSVILAGARAEAYLRRLNQFVDFERHQNTDRSTSLTPEQVLTMWTAADRDYREGLRDWQRGASEPKTAHWSPR